MFLHSHSFGLSSIDSLTGLVSMNFNLCYQPLMRLLAALSLAFILASSALAEDLNKTRADQLDKLFGELHQTSAPQPPDKIVADIWALWARNDSATAELLLRQSVAAMNMHDLDAAEKMLIQLIEVYPEYAEAWNKRATLYYMEGRYDASLIDIEHVLDLEPRHFGALAGKSMILRAQGKNREAIAVMRETLSINPHMDSVAQAIKELLKDSPDI
jgi:tetratricopeptide (TPR) repeat protein